MKTCTGRMCFFHPTTYFGKDSWNQPLESAYEDETLRSVIFVNQSSVFDSHSRIFAPFYRQASLYSFITHEGDGRKSLNVAFSDIQQAFSYYMAHENDGRPFVIAGHSQGSYHGLRLLEEELVGRPALQQLVAAYLVGILIPADKLTRTLQGIPLCESPAQISCLMTWNTIGPDPHIFSAFNDILISYPSGYESIKGKRLVGVNPLTWSVDPGFADQELNLGGFIGGFDKTADSLDSNLTGAQISEGWLSIPEIEDARYHQIMLGREFYHVYDYALFHENIRQNVGIRINAYFSITK